MVDELKFHKLWNSYYNMRLEKSFDKFETEYKLIDKSLTDFKQLDIEMIKKFSKENEE